MKQQIVGKLTILLGSLPMLALMNCSSVEQMPAPVVSLKPPATSTFNTHVVKSGETLYEIAWQYGKTLTEIALANNIQDPYIIYPGQKLALTSPPTSDKVRTQSDRLLAKAHIKVATDAKLLAEVKSIDDETNQAYVPKFEEVDNLAVQSEVVSKPQTITKTKKTHSTNNNKVANAPIWTWPVNGKIVRDFSNKGHDLNKGIDIGGKLGSPVKAALPGKVVYSGNGLRGYGQLLIIKHDDDFLSAYAHNQELMVKEGQNVKQGQQIATMGQTGTEDVKLHFEIRYKGKPVNPLHYLPEQSA